MHNTTTENLVQTIMVLSPYNSSTEIDYLNGDNTHDYEVKYNLSPQLQFSRVELNNLNSIIVNSTSDIKMLFLFDYTDLNPQFQKKLITRIISLIRQLPIISERLKFSLALGCLSIPNRVNLATARRLAQTVFDQHQINELSNTLQNILPLDLNDHGQSRQALINHLNVNTIPLRIRPARIRNTLSIPNNQHSCDHRFTTQLLHRLDDHKILLGLALLISAYTYDWAKSNNSGYYELVIFVLISLSFYKVGRWIQHNVNHHGPKIAAAISQNFVSFKNEIYSKNQQLDTIIQHITGFTESAKQAPEDFNQLSRQVRKLVSTVGDEISQLSEKSGHFINEGTSILSTSKTEIHNLSGSLMQTLSQIENSINHGEAIAANAVTALLNDLRAFRRSGQNLMDQIGTTQQQFFNSTAVTHSNLANSLSQAAHNGQFRPKADIKVDAKTNAEANFFKCLIM